MPTEADLRRLLASPAESLTVEYKGWLSLAQNEHKAVLAKAAIALANEGGGIIVLGMREASSEGGALRSLPRPEGMSRYSQDHINAAISRYADPAFHCELAFAAHPETGVEHAFVLVPGGLTVPVMSRRDCEGVVRSQRCYIRKPGPRSEEALTAEEWRRVLDRCVRARRQDMLEAIRAIVHGQVEAVPPAPFARDELVAFCEEANTRWQERIDELPPHDPARCPHGHYEVGFSIVGGTRAQDLTELRRRMQEASRIRLTGWTPFWWPIREEIQPRPTGEVIEAWLGHHGQQRSFHDAAHSDFWWAHPRGKFFLLRGYHEDSIDRVQPGTGIDITLPIWRVSEILLYAARLAREFGEDTEILTRCRCTGLRNRELISIDVRRAILGVYRSVDDEVVLETQVPTDRIEDNLVEIMHSLLVPLYERFSFYELSVTFVAQELEHLRGSRF